MNPTNDVIWPIAAYLLGAVPFGLLLVRHQGIDLRQQGSGNVGATNVARVAGKRWGLMTLVADAGKGFFPVLGCRLAGPGEWDLEWGLALTGIAAFLGHCFPIYLGFRGGKGVATAAGVFLALCPGALGLAAVVFCGVVKRWGYVSVGSLAAATLTPLFIQLICPSPALQAVAWAMAAVIWLKHRDNLRRLRRGEEKGIGITARR